MKDFFQLKKNLKKDYSKFNKIKLAILGDSATQFLSQSIRAMAFEYKLNIEIFESDFNQIQSEIIDNNSELYKFSPEIIIIFQSSHKLLQKYNKLNISQQITLAQEELDEIQNLNNNINENINAKIIYYNYNEINDYVYGNYANKIENSFIFQLRKLNYNLMIFATKYTNFYICDISSIQNITGRGALFQNTIYINADMHLSIDVLPEIASNTLDIISAINGKIKKCIIVDLDNTMWGGVIGDDGIENIQIGSLGIGKAFTEFQYWLKKLKNRGIILAVCSKNTKSVAKEVFIKHPEMVLKLDDFAIFVANWENKADNIKHIQQVLNISFDSMVFIDDNPFERNLVRDKIKDICVPELPEDPAEYLDYLYSLNLFDTISISDDDIKRTEFYQVENKRKIVESSYSNIDDYLKKLEMIATVEEFNTFNTPRIAQLSQRSNQFNLRTIRYTENDIKKILESDKYYTFSFKLKDKFGDNGLISVVILKKDNNKTLFIDTWFMSCRVLKRGMESFVLNTLVNFALDKDVSFLKGEYIETKKNDLVKLHYKNLGFTQKDKYWYLSLNDYKTKKCYINNNTL